MLRHIIHWSEEETRWSVKIVNFSLIFIFFQKWVYNMKFIIYVEDNDMPLKQWMKFIERRSVQNEADRLKWAKERSDPQQNKTYPAKAKSQFEVTILEPSCGNRTEVCDFEHRERDCQIRCYGIFWCKV